jgi:hypothetical protein
LDHSSGAAQKQYRDGCILHLLFPDNTRQSVRLLNNDINYRKSVRPKAAVGVRILKVRLVRDSILDRFIFAAACTNDRSFHCNATPRNTRLQLNPRCARTQREN